MENKPLQSSVFCGLSFMLWVISIFIIPSSVFALSSQSIITDLTTPSSAVLGSTFLVTGASDSGLPVDITVTGDCSIAGDIVTITGTVNNCVVHYNQAGDATYGPALEVTETVVTLSDNQTTPDGSGSATVNNITPQVVIKNSGQTANIIIASGTANPEINLGSFVSGGTGIIPAINITSNNANNTNVDIPASTTVTSADSTWNGIISAPTITTVTLPSTGGNTDSLSMAIEVGFTGAKLSFDKAVRILLPGQAGKKAGYTRSGISFTEITNICASDSQSAGDALAADGDCKIDVGSDLVIWTKHFTSFATYTEIASGGSVGGGGGQLSYVNSIKGDFNSDKKVDELDLAMMMANWGTSGTSSFDLNNDKKVDKYDFALLILNWKK